MKAAVLQKTGIATELMAIAAIAMIGLGITFVAGHAQSAVLHDAAHDTRHVTGFPCH